MNYGILIVTFVTVTVTTVLFSTKPFCIHYIVPSKDGVVTSKPSKGLKQMFLIIVGDFITYFHCLVNIKEDHKF